MIHSYRFVLIGCAASALLAAGDSAGRDARAVLARLPLRFEANQGQFDSSVRFAARTSSYTVALTAQGAAMKFPGSPRISLSLEGASQNPSLEPQDPLSA